jgi:hypothetical protein
MRGLGSLVTALAAASSASAFVSPVLNQNMASARSRVAFSLDAVDKDCGCDSVVMAGKPPQEALALNAREVIGKLKVVNAAGQEILMEDLLGVGDVSIAVLLRSLG